jgi:hypothetical protein
VWRNKSETFEHVLGNWKSNDYKRELQRLLEAFVESVASDVKIYQATDSMARFIIKIYFFSGLKRSSLLPTTLPL